MMKDDRDQLDQLNKSHTHEGPNILDLVLLTRVIKLTNKLINSALDTWSMQGRLQGLLESSIYNPA